MHIFGKGCSYKGTCPTRDALRQSTGIRCEYFSLANNNAYFIFRHNKSKVSKTTLANDMAKQAFSNWDKIEYKAEVPVEVTDLFVKHFFKRFWTRERRKRAKEKPKSTHCARDAREKIKRAHYCGFSPT
jgi:hypothetical protein